MHPRDVPGARVPAGERARDLSGSKGGSASNPDSATEPRLCVVLACDHLLRYTTGLANGLVQQDCHVSLLTRAHDQDFGREPGAMQAYLDQALDSRVRFQTIAGRVRDPMALGSGLAARRRLAGSGAAVVHLQDSVVTDPRLSWAVAAGRRGYALTVHDPSFHPGDRTPTKGQRRLRRRLIHRASLIFVHGEALRDELVGAEAPRAPVVSIPHGSDAGGFSALPDRRSLLFFGRIAPYKGLDVLLDAMPRVWESVPDARLTIAGRGELPRHRALEDRRIEVRQGHVPDARVSDLFADATCVVLPYRQASQSGVGALALEHGRAIVATAVGALPELVNDRVGRLVPPEDAGALANALVEVVGASGLAEQLGRSAASEGVGWDRVAELTIEAYARHMPREGIGEHLAGARA